MTKKHFIELANKIKTFTTDKTLQPLTDRDWVNMLGDFCASQNPRFNRGRWMAYIAGICGPNGGPVKKGK